MTFPRESRLEKVKIETEKVNKYLKYMPTDNITEMKELIYAGAKLVSYKMGIPKRMSTEIQKLDRKKKERRTNKEVATKGETTKEDKTHRKDFKKTSLTTQLEEINQKISVKKGKLKRYRDWVKQYKNNRTK